MKKRIAFLSSCVRGGGAGWSLYYLIKHIDKTFFEPFVILPDLGIFGDKYRELGVRVVIAPYLPERSAKQHFHRVNFITKAISNFLNFIGLIRTVFWVKRFAKEEECDLIYGNNMLVKSIAAFAGRFSGIPCVLHIRNLHEKTFERFLYRRIFRMRSVIKIISNSKASAKPFIKDVAHKIIVIHNGIDVGDYSGISKGSLRAELGIKRNTIIGFTGNLIPRKGIDVLLRAVARVMKNHHQLILVVVGRVPIGSNTDYMSLYKNLSIELGIEDQVKFMGFRDEVRPCVRDMDILVLPSRQEPFGRSIIEAMALEVPVVASNVGGIPEIITHSKDGFLAECGNVEEFADFMERLVDDRQLRQRMGKDARKTIIHNFSVEVLTSKIQSILKDLLP